MSLMPILVASAFAFQQNSLLHMEALFAIITASLSIQIATNLHNDAQDFLNGTDRHSRIGPQRITQSLLSTPAQTKNAAYAFFVVALFCGLYLVWLGGGSILAIGLVSVLAGYGYSAGPFPISRTPFGEFFVLVFFGVISLSTTFYLLTGQWSVQTFIFGMAVGSPACAVLLVNNYRDLEDDLQAGRKTLAIIIGATASKWFYSCLMLLPFFILALSLNDNSFIWLPFLALPFVAKAIFFLFKTADKIQLNKALGMTAACQIILCINLSLCFILDGLF